ncbi:MAG: arylsulfatase A-like enzyme [Planctomycetota bacterium]|jgi:arylsulfatase A-like enzyme
MARPLEPRLRSLAACALVWLATACGSGDKRPEHPGPNVVLLVVDTLRADHLGSYGRSPSPSPVMDEVAANGIRFDQAFAQSSWTRPSFASFLTGRIPRSTGIQREKGDALHPKFDTLAEQLQRAGYLTIGATANPNVNRVFGFAQGFDRFLDSEVVWRWMDPEPGAPVADVQSMQSADDLLGKVSNLVGAGDDGPYFLMIDLMEVHEYRGLDDPSPDLGEGGMTRRYDASIATVDAAIGRFLRDLRAKPGFEDALVIITSDHGEGLDDHPGVEGASGHGFVVYGSQAHVPLLLDDGPGPLPERMVIDAPARLMDLFPTVLEVAQIEIPRGLDGRSLLPLIRGEENPVQRPRSIVIESYFRGSSKLGIYDPEWRLFVNRDGHPGTELLELYRTGMTENGAANNLAADNPDLVGKLAARLKDWERLNPSAETWSPEGGIPEDVQQQLEDVGY